MTTHPERTMPSLQLLSEEFQHILRCCQRVLVNEFTPVADLKHYLVARLREQHPDAAAVVEQLTDAQMHELATMCAGFRQEATSALWS
jgi:hypothetical protein